MINNGAISVPLCIYVHIYIYICIFADHYKMCDSLKLFYTRFASDDVVIYSPQIEHRKGSWYSYPGIQEPAPLVSLHEKTL